jgi:hypothetical protein
VAALFSASHLDPPRPANINSNPSLCCLCQNGVNLGLGIPVTMNSFQHGSLVVHGDSERWFDGRLPVPQP